MKEFNSVNDILDFAINSEQEAVDFYTDLANQASTEDMKKVFEEFAQEEVSHKARLTKVKTEGVFEMTNEEVTDLKIADYMVAISSLKKLFLSLAIEESKHKLRFEIEYDEYVLREN